VATKSYATSTGDAKTMKLSEHISIVDKWLVDRDGGGKSIAQIKKEISDFIIERDKWNYSNRYKHKGPFYNTYYIRNGVKIQRGEV